MRMLQLKMLLLLPMLAVIFDKVQAAPAITSNNNQLLNEILQVLREQGEQIKHLGEKFETSQLQIASKNENLKTEENYLLSVLTGQQTQLASKMEQIRTDIHAHDAKLTKTTDKLACQIAQQNLTMTSLDGKQYYFSYNQPGMTWYDAQTFCRSHHMDLVSVETQDEWRALLPEVKKLGDKLGYPWSSATDSAQEGKWTWGSGRDVTFHARNDVENRDNKDCLYLYTEYWGDASCSIKLPFVCEVNLVC